MPFSMAFLAECNEVGGVVLSGRVGCDRDYVMNFLSGCGNPLGLAILAERVSDPKVSGHSVPSRVIPLGSRSLAFVA